MREVGKLSQHTKEHFTRQFHKNITILPLRCRASINLKNWAKYLMIVLTGTSIEINLRGLIIFARSEDFLINHLRLYIMHGFHQSGHPLLSHPVPQSAKHYL